MRRLAHVIVVLGVVLATPAAHALSKQEVIRRVFAREGPSVALQAVHVAGCESAGDPTGRVLRPWATNGQYLGLFQLGAPVRERFLRGPWFGAWANARAALALWRSSGRSWQQWSCSWAAG